MFPQLYWNKTKQSNYTSGKEKKVDISMSELCYFIAQFKVNW